MKHAILFTAVLALSGCAQIDPYRSAAIDTLAKANDRAREDAEFVLCRGISIGAWRRAYGEDAIRANAWRTLCSDRAVEVPTTERMPPIGEGLQPPASAPVWQDPEDPEG